MQKKNSELCTLLAERLRMDWSARELSSLCMGSIGGSARWRWRRIRRARGLHNMFQNAGLMLKMARCGAPINGNLARELRHEAKAVRRGIAKLVVEFVFHAAEERVAAEALRAEQAYAEMEMHMSVLLASCANGCQSHFASAR